MRIGRYHLGKVLGVFLVTIVLLTENAFGWTLFQRQISCHSFHQGRSARQTLLELNSKYQNFLELPDYTESSYIRFREIHQKQIKNLEKVLSKLNFEKKYTEKQKSAWAEDVVSKIGELIGENDSLRQRAQAELLSKGLSEYLIHSSQSVKLRTEMSYRLQRAAEIIFENQVTRWLGFPLWLPQLRYKELGPALVKKILFEGYDRNEAEVMKALRETNRVSAFNKFSAIYRKVMLVATLTIAPLVSYLSIEKSVETMTDSAIHQVLKAEAQSQVLKDMDWRAMENSLIFVHAKENLESQLGRPLNDEEIRDLKSYMDRNSNS